MRNNMSKDNHSSDAWTKIVKRAWADPKFKEELIRHPEKIIKEYNIDTHGRKIKILENNNHEVYFVLPKKPHGLTSEDLKRIDAAGKGGEVFLSLGEMKSD